MLPARTAVTLALAVGLAGCSSDAVPVAPATPPAPPPAPTEGFGTISGTFVSPAGGENLAMRVKKRSDGTIVAFGAAPSGDFRLRVPTGSYTVEFARPNGDLYSNCDVDVDVTFGSDVAVNGLPRPPACVAPIWSPIGDPMKAYRGSRGDVRFTPGDYQGYRIEACDSEEGLLRVIGKGRNAPPDNNDGQHGPALNAWITRTQAHAETALVPMAASIGFGASCRADRAASFRVYVTDYRQVDEVVRRLAAVIGEDDLGVEFMLEVPQATPRD